MEGKSWEKGRGCSCPPSRGHLSRFLLPKPRLCLRPSDEADPRLAPCPESQEKTGSFLFWGDHHPATQQTTDPCPGQGVAPKESLALTTFYLLPLPGKPYGADDFLPVLMYVLARSNLTEMLLNVEYMMELMDPALQLGEGESLYQTHLRTPGAHRPPRPSHTRGSLGSSTQTSWIPDSWGTTTVPDMVPIPGELTDYQGSWASKETSSPRLVKGGPEGTRAQY